MSKNAIIYCQGIAPDQLQEGLTLGEYEKTDPEVQATSYRLYQKDGAFLLEFTALLDFGHVLYLVSDLLEVSREQERDIQGFVDTDPKSKITEHWRGQRVCLYLSEPLKRAMQEEPDKYLDFVDIVSETNQHSSIEIDNFFSYTSEDQRPYQEPDLSDFKEYLLGSGEYLYEEGNFEEEYLEDLEDERNSK